MFRDEFVVKKRFFDERWSFNFFPRKRQPKKSFKAVLKDYGELDRRMTRSHLIRHIGCPSEPTKTGRVQNSQNKIYQNFETSIS